METPRYLHKHLLKLVVLLLEGEEGGPTVPKRKRTCDHCNDGLFGCRVYACDECSFYLHEACGNLPQRIQHLFHPCPLFLKLVPVSDAPEHEEMMIFYRCEACNFELDDESALYQPASFKKGEEILYCSYGHPLKLSYDKEANAELRCNRCKEGISGKRYSCRCCGYYLHEYCAFLPSKIRHFFHPCPLILKHIPQWFECDPCQQDFYDIFSYHCENCNFDMHVECTQFSPIAAPNEEGMLHFSHHHPLKKLTDDEADKRLDCRGCKKHVLGESYACFSCGYYLHLSCADLPREIQHLFHSCPLSLEFFVRTQCDACSKVCDNVLGYHCEECDFNMHVECTRFSPIAPNEEGILHFSHHHPLKLTDEEASYCRGCKKPISGESYACFSCGYFLHLTCADLPREIQHFFHECTLSLKVLDMTQCDACFNKCDSVFGYHCDQCVFYMHVACTQFQSDDQGDRIQDLSHHHPLQLFEAGEREDFLECNLCNKKMTGQEIYGACELCQFHIHKSCMGLPNTHQKSDHFRPIITEDGRKRVQDMSHEHFLFVFEDEGNDFGKHGRCHRCGREIPSGTAYAGCEHCEFYTHKSCLGSLLEIQLPCHPCPLSLGPHTSFDCSVCDAHKKAIPYQCEKCMFYMDVECARSLQEIDEGDTEESILHFCHHHPLQLFKDPKRDKTDELLGRKFECLVCAGTASGLTYGCKWCGFYLHKSCLDVLPPRISIGDCSFVLSGFESSCRRCGNCISEWGFFPDTVFARPWCIPCALREALSFWVSPSSMLTQLDFHPCCLALAHSATFTCNACFTHCHIHAYYCDQCDFYVGVKCAQISGKSCHGEKKTIQHFCHFHPLQSSQDSIVLKASCKICGTFCLEPSYFCGQCDFHVHKSCLDALPQKIDDHFLYCTLILLTTSFYRCLACERENNSGLTFRSIERGIKLCMECALRPKNIQNEDGTFTSIHHWHKLALVEGLEKDEAQCLLCKEKCSTRVLLQPMQRLFSQSLW